MKKLLLVLSLSFVLYGCSTTETLDTSSEGIVLSEEVSSEAAETVSVTISLTDGGTVIAGSEKTVEVEAGANLLAVMRENYAIEEADGFITAIDGQTQVEETAETKAKYWLFDVNGESSMVGAADVALQEGDVIVWNLTEM
ncbi:MULTISPECIES: DUF4430 domain-containing protein [Trichococcus]|uniref:Transcobalamin-like C-terminal domain-containing protein n=1 Tax=Trichococcus pasteurii TaxID=43064 RepID=A0A1W1IJM9_9LACT|nr:MULTISPECIES: DUF4430 domain-containing protein [Trichococcus]CZR04556.1 Hypothetical protein TES5_2099 [Trichococcus sp. ES5]SFF09664.1 protein of unknown function [Trichococcus pasteurii]SHG14002.1 protein of unknown function [Trichococcus flocculiformis]SLM53201.1 Hypothetical protein TPAS_2928 [Trichococcus pasteurii]SSB94082.1 Hypothetical protein TPAS_2928 [Trichococcus pasteurii]